MSAALIAPVSKWYRKPTPWWIDSFEEEGLQPILETDEIVEEDNDMVDEQEEPTVDDEEPEVADAEPTRESTVTWSLYMFYVNALNMSRHHV